jgi:hypothetical protein
VHRCKTRVHNDLLPSGCTIADEFVRCAVDAKNHGQFVRCAVHLITQLKRTGAITPAEGHELLRCVVRLRDDDSGGRRDDDSDSDSDRH